MTATPDPFMLPRLPMERNVDNGSRGKFLARGIREGASLVADKMVTLQRARVEGEVAQQHTLPAHGAAVLRRGLEAVLVLRGAKAGFEPERRIDAPLWLSAVPQKRSVRFMSRAARAQGLRRRAPWRRVLAASSRCRSEDERTSTGRAEVKLQRR